MGTTLSRYRVTWSGFPGGPGVSTFYQDWSGASPPNLNTSLRTFFVGVAPYLPSNVTLTFSSAVDQIDDATGNLVGNISQTAGATVQGSLGTVYQAPGGILVSWVTGTILDGHRIRGHTFLVPASSETATGSVASAATSAISTAAAALISAASGTLVVWHRPIPSGKPHGPRPGGHATVTSASVSSKFTVLRSRRD